MLDCSRAELADSISDDKMLFAVEQAEVACKAAARGDSKLLHDVIRKVTPRSPAPPQSLALPSGGVAVTPQE
eukprot:2542871-Alexandrium_andersonii.AAC.1